MKNEKEIDELVNALEDSNDSTREVAIASLKKEGEPVVRVLIERYAKPRSLPFHKDGIVEVLSSFDESAIGPLVASIAENTQPWNGIVAKILGEIQGSRALEVILEKRQWILTSDLAPTLGKIGDPRGVEPLIERLAEESVELSAVRERDRTSAVYYGPRKGNFDDCLWALGQIGDVRAFETLQSYARRGVLAAFEGLVYLGDKRANDFFHAVASKDPSSDEAIAAIRGLQKLGGSHYLSFFLQRMKYCIETDDLNIDTVRIRLNFKYQFTVAVLHEAILSCGDEAITPVMAALRDKAGTRRFRLTMKQILRNIGTSSIGVLVEGLQDKDKFVRETCVDVLGQLKARNAITPLVMLLKNPFRSFSFRCRVTQTLNKITGADLNKVWYRKWRRWLKEHDIDIDKTDTTVELP